MTETKFVATYTATFRAIVSFDVTEGEEYLTSPSGLPLQPGHPDLHRAVAELFLELAEPEDLEVVEIEGSF